MNSAEDSIPLPSVGILTEAESARQLHDDLCRSRVANERQRLIADIQTAINGIKIPESCEGKRTGEYVKVGLRLAITAINEALKANCRHNFFRDFDRQANKMVESDTCGICGYKKSDDSTLCWKCKKHIWMNPTVGLCEACWNKQPPQNPQPEPKI